MADMVQADIPKKKRLLPILIVIAIVVGAGAAGGAVRWWQQDQQQKKLSEPTALQKKAASASDKALTGKYDEAYKEFDELIKNPHLSKEDRALLISNKATTYSNEKKYESALAGYQESEKINPTQDVAEAIGRTAEAMGNKELAIAAYKKAITRISKDDPVGDAMKEMYQNTIRNLGGQP